MFTSQRPVEEFSAYVCPTCKGTLNLVPEALYCAVCSRSYPLAGSIPDFLAPAMEHVDAPLVRRVNRADRGVLKLLGGLYESRLWYSLVVRLYLGKDATSLADLTRRIQDAMNVEEGRVLDAACGPATYGRRVATPTRAVYGIDLSLAMLQQGAAYIQSEQVANISLARTRVETLPFSDAFFDFAICSGALHLFPDPALALKEIGRTLKPGARLVGLTFAPGSQGLVQYAWFRERLKKRGTVHLFELPELEMDLQQAGFEHFWPERLGSGVFFTAEKCLHPAFAVEPPNF